MHSAAWGKPEGTAKDGWRQVRTQQRAKGGRIANRKATVPEDEDDNENEEDCVSGYFSHRLFRPLQRE